MAARAAILATVLVTALTILSGCGGGGSDVSQQPTPTGSAATPPPRPTAEPAPVGGLFAAQLPWTKDISSAERSDRSDAVIAALNKAGGWGNDNVLQTDFSLPVLFADSTTPRMEVVGIDGYCYGGPDCDEVPAMMPVPADANIEGSPDLSCDISTDDCHLLVVERDERRLYEVYQANQTGGKLTVQGYFVWDLDKAYPETLRGAQCTSADAAGFPIAALTPTADEVAAGSIPHALRFILPNDRMKKDVYVAPATHAGGPESTDEHAPPYGVRFRLKADFDESAFSPSQKVVITALKTYGMLLSDGGEIALTFADDKTSTAKWAELGIESNTFSDIAPDQFEVVDLGPEQKVTYDCVRNP